MTTEIGNMILSLRKSHPMVGGSEQEREDLRVDRDTYRPRLQALVDAGALQVTPHPAHRPEPRLEAHETILHTYWEGALAEGLHIDGITYRVNETTAAPEVQALLREIRSANACNCGEDNGDGGPSLPHKTTCPRA